MPLTPEEEQELLELERLAGIGGGGMDTAPVQSPGFVQQFENAAQLAMPFNMFMPSRENIPSPMEVAGEFGRTVGGLVDIVRDPGAAYDKIYNSVSNASASDVINTVGQTAASAAGGLLGAYAGPKGIPFGAAVGGEIYDQVNQLIGNVPDTPLRQDLAEMVGGNMLPEYATMGIMKLPGQVQKIGGALENIYDKDKALLGAISQNPSDYAQGVRGQIPLDEAVTRLKNDSNLFSNYDPNSKTPFSNLHTDVTDEITDTAQDINRMVNSGGQVPLGDIDPRMVLDADELTYGAMDKTRANVVKNEFNYLAKKALSESDYNDFQKALSEYSKSPSQDTAYKLLKYEDQIANSPLTAREVQVLRQGWDSEAKYNGGDADLSRTAQNYETLGNAARTSLSDAVDNPEFPIANQRYGDLQTLERPLNLMQGQEKTYTPPGMLQRGIDMFRNGVVRDAAGKVVASAGDPNLLLKRAMGDTIPQKLGATLNSPMISGIQDASNAAMPWVAGAGAINQDVAATQPNGLDLSLASPAQAEPMTKLPATSPVKSPTALSVDLNPPRPLMKEGFAVPRNLNVIEPQGVSNMIPFFAPPQDAQPLLNQWNRIVASGDKIQMAQYLGALAEQFPDFPLQRGAVTGLPSEFDIGDGKLRLFSPNDIMKWEAQIDRSPLREDEKALRIASLRKDGLIVPMDVQTNNLEELMSAAQQKGQFGSYQEQAQMETKVREYMKQGLTEIQAKQRVAMETPLEDSPQNLAMKTLMQNYSFQPRSQSLFGSRRVE